jgi:lysophospholipid acyltransferase (LPLAT)-like uncharacterized protein
MHGVKLRNPRVIAIVGVLAANVLRLWLSLVRVRIHFSEKGTNAFDKPKDNFLYCFWHENILVPGYYYGRKDIYLLHSLHADGELMTRIAQNLGFSHVRGSTTKGGMKALRELIRVAEHSHIAVTPDGPKGPRRVVSPGIVYLASRSCKPVVPFGFGYTNAWRANSWDRMALPRPFSKAFCVVGKSILVPPDLDSAGLEEYRLLVEAEMHRIDALSELWAKQGPRYPKEEDTLAI